MSKQIEKETEKGIFLDGRGYTASDLYKLIALLVGNGVYANELAPTATNENMSITHGTGHAWIGGVAYVNTTPFVLDIATADGSLNRYDSLMLRLNLSINEVYAVIVQGEYATTPTPPACTRNVEIFDLKICDIYVPAGCTKITQDLITDTRLDSSVCGVPVFPVEHLDMTSFYHQIAADLSNFQQKEQASFVEWSNNRKTEILNLVQQLSNLVGTDTVGELVLEINNKISKNGDTLEGTLNANGHRLTGLPSPTDDTDAVPYSLVRNLARYAWQNVGYTNTFPSQTITITDRESTLAVISFCASKDNMTLFTTANLRFGNIASTHQIAVVYAPESVSAIPLSRNVTIQRRNESTVTLEFGDAYRNGAAVNNDYLIPLDIEFIREVT